MNTFIIPIMLSHIGYGTFLFLACINILSAPIVWFFYPETANKSLEQVNLLFTSESVLVSNNMIEYYRRVDEADGNVANAARRLLDEVNGSGSAARLQPWTEM